MSVAKVFNVQHFCLDDGPGIRTTIFLFGCPLRCPWCCNPEGVYPNGEVFDADLPSLFGECLSDLPFYGKDGGVTFSGGEPINSVFEIRPLIEDLRKTGITICFETSMFVSKEKFRLALSLADFICADIKVGTKSDAQSILGYDRFDWFVENLSLLKKSKVAHRYRLIMNTLNGSMEQVAARLRLIEDDPNALTEVFNTHNLMNEKRLKLGVVPSKSYQALDSLEIEKIYTYVSKNRKKSILLEV